MRTRYAWISLCVLCVSAVNSFCATPKDQLLGLVPNDAGFVVMLQDFRTHSEKFRNSPFVKQFMQTPAGKSLLSVDAAQSMKQADDELTKELGIPWQQLRDELIGDAVVFVYRPGPVDKPDAEEGVVLMHLRDPSVAEKVLGHINEGAKKDGRFESKVELQHAGRKYEKFVRKDEPAEFVYRHDKLFVFGSGEKLVQQIIAADINPPAADSEMTKRLRDLNVASSTFVWWLNPRAFDPALAAQAQKVDGTGAAVLKAFSNHWQAIDGVALFFDAAAEAKLGVVIAARPEAFPPTTRLFLNEMGKPSALWGAFPQDALLTIAGRFALPPALEAGASLLPDETLGQIRKAATSTLGTAFGPKVLEQLPNQLGPDWGFCLSAPTGDEHIPTMTAAVRLEETEPPVVPRVVNGVNMMATMAVVGYNVHHTDAITPETESQGDVVVHYFVNDATFPTGLKPAFAWKGGFLVFASSPDAVRKFNPPSTAPTGSDAPFLRVAMRGWTNYLRGRKADAVKFLGTRAMTIDEAATQIDDTLKLMELFDGLDLSLKSEANRATLTLRLRTTVPLE